MPMLAVPADPPNFWNGRTVLTGLGLLVLLCVGVAIVLTLVTARPDTFGRNLLYSLCIGSGTTAWCVGLAQLPWLERLGHRRAIAIGMLGATPLGYMSGHTIAAALLGDPMRAAAWFEPGRRLGLIATVLASIAAFVLIWGRHRLLAEAAARSEAQRLAAEAQLRLLRTQLEPHMLFNTLANLRSLVEVDTPLAQRMIDQLIVYLRSSLTASRTETTTLAQEFAQLRAYLEIMALRMGARMSYALVLPEALATAAVPSMLLQPLVENAIRHGIEPKVGPGRIEIEARRIDGAIEIVVADTGLGLPTEEALAAPSTPGTSYGLTHVRERLAAAYGERASLELQRRSPQGTAAIVRMPS